MSSQTPLSSQTSLSSPAQFSSPILETETPSSYSGIDPPSPEDALKERMARQRGELLCQIGEWKDQQTSEFNSRKTALQDLQREYEQQRAEEEANRLLLMQKIQEEDRQKKLQEEEAKAREEQLELERTQVEMALKLSSMDLHEGREPRAVKWERHQERLNTASGVLLNLQQLLQKNWRWDIL
jgi:hypothetical protein